jgi:hypothetical protein
MAELVYIFLYNCSKTATACLHVGTAVGARGTEGTKECLPCSAYT